MHKPMWASTLAIASAIAFAIATLTVASEAHADANLHSADVLRPGDNMLYGEAGWPDVAFGFQHGVTDKVDVGFRLSFFYGAEYTTDVGLGLGLRVPIRITPIKRDKFSFQIHFDPGIKFDSFGGCRGNLCRGGPGGPLEFGLWLYFGLDFGIHITREATLTIGMDAPIHANVTNDVYGQIPLLFGPAFEYDIDDHIAVGAQVRVGPDINAHPCPGAFGGNGTCSGAVFGLLANGFFAYRL
jgi:hypothetical protein